MNSSNQKMTMQEAGYLGYLASREKQQEAKRLRYEEYAKNPNTCKQCGKPLPFDKKYYKFCSHACSAIHSNNKRTFDELTCACCGKRFSAKSNNKKYCSRKCQILHVSFKEFIKDKESNLSLDEYIKMKDNEENKITGKCINCGKSLKKGQTIYCSFNCQKIYSWGIKKELIEKTGQFSCVKVGLTKDETNRKEAKRYLVEKHGHKCAICGLSEWMDQPIPLVVDHIDGNPSNHKIENFRLVCGNCDMQLPTYKAKNKGKGRKYRRKSQTQA